MVVVNLQKFKHNKMSSLEFFLENKNYLWRLQIKIKVINNKLILKFLF